MIAIPYAARELAPGGEVRAPESFEFDFRNVEMRYDSYRGQAVRLRYFVRITVSKSLASVVKEFPICVQNPQDVPAAAEPIKVCMLLLHLRKPRMMSSVCMYR